MLYDIKKNPPQNTDSIFKLCLLYSPSIGYCTGYILLAQPPHANEDGLAFVTKDQILLPGDITHYMSIPENPAECTFGEGIAFSLDGMHETAPHTYEQKQIIHNATIEILECKDCGDMAMAWYRQEDTWEE